MSNNVQGGQLSALSAKLIFKDVSQQTSDGEIDAALLLTADALNVCKLLAIDPEDILQRDQSQFKEKGLTEQRLRLRFEYYEEKRQLKLKAIENVLIKCQVAKSGHGSPEAAQIMELLEEIRGNKTMFKTPNKNHHLSPTGSKAGWTFLSNSPHSPGGRLPFIGGAKGLQNSGVNYKKIHTTNPSMKSSRIISGMPKNLLEEDAQKLLLGYMNNTFCNNNTDSRDHKRAQSQMGEGYDIGCLHSLGFDMPAQAQINRISKKLEKWNKINENNDIIKEETEQKNKAAKKMEDKIDQRIVKKQNQNNKQDKQKWDLKNGKYEGRRAVYQQNERNNQKDVMTQVKEYYKDTKEFLISKEEREKQILAKLQEYYDACTGAKAEQLEKQMQSCLAEIEEGQNLHNKFNAKMQAKTEKINDHRRNVSDNFRSRNMQTESVKFVVYENREKEKFDQLEQHVMMGQKQQKTLAKLNKTTTKTMNDLAGKNLYKYNKMSEHKSKEKNDQKMAVKDAVELRQETEQKLIERREEWLKEKQQIAEKHRLRELDAKENNARIKQIDVYRNMKVYEKHMLKDKSLNDYHASLTNISKMF